MIEMQAKRPARQKKGRKFSVRTDFKVMAGMVLSPLPDRRRGRMRAGPLQAKNSRCSMSQGDHFRDEQFCTALP